MIYVQKSTQLNAEFELCKWTYAFKLHLDHDVDHHNSRKPSPVPAPSHYPFIKSNQYIDFYWLILKTVLVLP